MTKFTALVKVFQIRNDCFVSDDWHRACDSYRLFNSVRL